MWLRDFFGRNAFFRTLRIAGAILAIGILLDIIGRIAFPESNPLQMLNKTLVVILMLVTMVLLIQAAGYGQIQRRRVKSEQSELWERHFGKIFVAFIFVVLGCGIVVLM